VQWILFLANVALMLGNIWFLGYGWVKIARNQRISRELQRVHTELQRNEWAMILWQTTLWLIARRAHVEVEEDGNSILHEMRITASTPVIDPSDYGS
jgi:hypothetical protein